MPERIAWITGASSGIGEALAIELADHGWRVAISARRADALAAVADQRPEAITAYPLNVTDATACADAAQRIATEHGPIDLAVFNAGIGASFDVRHFDAADVNRRMTVNYGGTVNGIGAVLPAMQARGTGRIAMTASVAGYRGLPGAAPYAASKAAMISLAESLHLDLVGSGVAVSVICPGYVTTPLTADNKHPMPFVIGAADAARRIRQGLEAGRFEIAFPRRLVWLLKTFQRLPYAAYFPIIRRVTGA
ncbi:SDR family oxidoreductase [Salinisphaera sp. LB1]|uniref:SDR family NAD(P)-dependent oxidoreductase n=1 Tax=Salinisphaera sp. LB1 TaxID=2183911 RepID=UPI000D706658|nr:SDR family NAD(P)-dependent oxidoreductase [Salinisphaera sp. LB1]AWN14687.1 Oxidoreductase, short-chain dehydrogenase/reductase family [Salinisphaera sp. LB1]